MMNYTITGYSTALFATWYFVEELGILFDAGDGVSSSLLHKAGKINHVFISHADRDHLTGLLQFNQLNARPGFPIIHYPRHCGSFPPFEAFSKKFDPHVNGTIWKSIQEEDSTPVKEDISVQSVRTNHVTAETGISKSLGFKVYQTRRKLKTELAHLPPDQIRNLMVTHGKENLTTEIRINVLSYSGDTPVDAYEKWNHSQILIHEATFLGGTEDKHIHMHGNKHSTLTEVIRMVAEINVDKLILGHFSSRYSHEQIDARIKSLCKEYRIQIPVYRVLPGQTHTHILGQEPIHS